MRARRTALNHGPSVYSLSQSAPRLFHQSKRLVIGSCPQGPSSGCGSNPAFAFNDSTLNGATVSVNIYCGPTPGAFRNCVFAGNGSATNYQSIVQIRSKVEALRAVSFVGITFTGGYRDGTVGGGVFDGLKKKVSSAIYLSPDNGDNGDNGEDYVPPSTGVVVLTTVDCIVTENRAYQAVVGVGSYAVYNAVTTIFDSNSNVPLGSEPVGCSSQAFGAAVLAFPSDDIPGGPVTSSTPANFTASFCVFSNNAGLGAGGAIALGGGAAVSVSDSVFVNNSANLGGAVAVRTFFNEPFTPGLGQSTQASLFVSRGNVFVANAAACGNDVYLVSDDGSPLVAQISGQAAPLCPLIQVRGGPLPNTNGTGPFPPCQNICPVYGTDGTCGGENFGLDTTAPPLQCFAPSEAGFPENTAIAYACGLFPLSKAEGVALAVTAAAASATATAAVIAAAALSLFATPGAAGASAAALRIISNVSFSPPPPAPSSPAAQPVSAQSGLPDVTASPPLASTPPSVAHSPPASAHEPGPSPPTGPGVISSSSPMPPPPTSSAAAARVDVTATAALLMAITAALSFQ